MVFLFKLLRSYFAVIFFLFSASKFLLITPEILYPSVLNSTDIITLNTQSYLQYNDAFSKLFYSKCLTPPVLKALLET